MRRIQFLKTKISNLIEVVCIKALKEQLERAGNDREPTDQEIINGITNISIHEGVRCGRSSIA